MTKQQDRCRATAAGSRFGEFEIIFTEVILRFDDLERIASDLRSHWKVGDGPVTSMIALLEAKGFVVARDIAGSVRLDGLCNWSEVDQRPYVLLAKDKQSFFRSQMDAAHEMAHAVLHRRLSQEDFEKDFKLIEEQAFRLASAFLMPSTTFALETKHKTLSGFIALKERWRVAAALLPANRHVRGQKRHQGPDLS
jgi:Zn-dependent peptidase ImmA (M78 family)